MPPSTRISCASPCFVRLAMESRATAPMLGSASPRKPSVPMCERSSPPAAPSGSLEVAWRSMDRRRSSASMPSPLSSTRMRSMPPLPVAMSMRLAPASSAFSMSSFTALAGRSTTSPAAMRLTVPSASRRIFMERFHAETRKRGGDNISAFSATPHARVSSFRLRQVFAGEHLALFHRGLIERIHAHQPSHDHGLEHEMHHQRADAALVDLFDMHLAHGAAVFGQRFGGRAGFGGGEIADAAAGKIIEAQRLRARGGRGGALSLHAGGDDRVELGAGAAEKKLELAVLIHRPEGGNGR